MIIITTIVQQFLFIVTPSLNCYYIDCIFCIAIDIDDSNYFVITIMEDATIANIVGGHNSYKIDFGFAVILQIIITADIIDYIIMVASNNYCF